MSIFTASTLSGAVGGILSQTASEAKGPITRTNDYLWNKAFPNLMPSPQEIMFAMRTGWLDEATGQAALQKHGIFWRSPPPDPTQTDFAWEASLAYLWDMSYRSQHVQPAPVELLTLLNRGTITREECDTRLQRLGMGASSSRRLVMSLADEIPGPSDLVRFAVRHVFEPDLVRRFGFAAEMPQAFLDWHAKQGFGYDLPPVDWRGNGPEPWTWANAFWWSHWVWPSPTFGYTAVQRLRPTGGPAGGPRDPSGQVFTPDDLFLLLRGNDYPPVFRPMLQALSYHPIGIRQIKQLRQFDLVDTAELTELFQDMGYRPDQSAVMANMTDRAEMNRRFKAEISGARSRILGAYDVGLMDGDQAAVQLFRLQLPDGLALDAFDAQDAETQQSQADGDRGIFAMLQAVDYDHRSKLAKSAVTATKRNFVKGVISRKTAQSTLQSYGIAAGRATEYVDLWTMEQTIPHREFTAERIVRLMVKGIITEEQAAFRLSNLGWSNDDVLAMLAEGELSVLELIQKQKEKAAKRANDAAKALAQEAKAKQAELDKAKQKLMKHSSPAQMTRWVKDGLISPQDMLGRLLELDWPADDAQRKVEQAIIDAEPKPKKGSTSTPTQGGGS